MDQPNHLPVSTSPSQPHPNRSNIDGTAFIPSPTHNLSYNRCVSRSMLTLVTLFLLLSCVIAIAWLVIDPQDPSIQLTSLSLSNISLSNPRFAANYDIVFNVNNTNKKPSLVIDHVRVVVFYGNALLSQKVLGETSIYIPKMSHETLKVALGKDSVHSIKNKVFKDLSDDWSRKYVNLSIEMFVRTRYELGAWPSKKKFFHGRCIGLSIEFVSTKGIGKLMNAGKDCIVHLD